MTGIIKILKKSHKKFQIFVDIDPNDKETIQGAYIFNCATVGAVFCLVATVYWAVFILEFPPILLGFFPCSIFFGALIGSFVGAVSFRIKYGFNK